MPDVANYNMLMRNVTILVGKYHVREHTVYYYNAKLQAFVLNYLHSSVI